MIRERLAAVSLLLCVRVLALTVSGADLIPRLNDGVLQVSAPKLHFLSGKQLERLRNGSSVPFDFQLTVSAGTQGNTLARSLERFVISYDLWEEKFSVVRQRDRRTSSVRLTATQAETWCLDNVSVPSSTDGRTAWLRLEIRSAENRDQIASSAEGISLSTLIEVFSHPPRNQQARWTLESGPFRIAELQR